MKTGDGGDLYLTRHGAPFREHLRPENWYDKAWFETEPGTAHRDGHRLSRAHPAGRRPGQGSGRQVVPRGRGSADGHVHAQQVRRGGVQQPLRGVLARHGDAGAPPARHRAHAQAAGHLRPGQAAEALADRPLAVPDGPEEGQVPRCRAGYLPPVHPDLRVGQGRERVGGLRATRARSAGAPAGTARLHRPRHRRPAPQGIPRAGLEAGALHRPAPARRRPAPSPRRRNRLCARGFRTARTHARARARRSPRPAGRPISATRRTDSPARPNAVFPGHLRPCRILGVDYVYGHSESTQGQLWVVGHDPALFDYFLPERWRRTAAASAVQDRTRPTTPGPRTTSISSGKSRASASGPTRRLPPSRGGGSPSTATTARSRSSPSPSNWAGAGFRRCTRGRCT